MSHLSSERLALLSDEPPTAAELAHLATCAVCGRERRAYETMRALAAQETARIGAPLSDWNHLRSDLVADGIIGDGPLVAHRRSRFTRFTARAAAAVLLVAGGVAAGRITAPAASADVSGTTVAAQGESASGVAAPAQFSSIDEARAAQSQFQTAYQAATAYIAQHDTTGPAVMSSAAIRTRLAALDHVSQAVGEALDEAPYDPVINGYYLTTLGQREATLRQLNTTLPVGMRITSY